MAGYGIHVAGCGGMWQGRKCVVGGQVYGIEGYMRQRWGHVTECGGIWQAVGVCGRGSDRVWGHMAGVGVCGRGVRPMAWMGHVVGVGVMVGCGGIWQGVGACGRGGSRVWGHMAGCGGIGSMLFKRV